jgi:hypothetical protein
MGSKLIAFFALLEFPPAVSPQPATKWLYIFIF